MAPRAARVHRCRRENRQVSTLELELTGEDMPPFEPGQFNMLTKFGVGEVAIGLSGDPAKLKTVTHTIHAVGPVTSALARLRTGDVIGVRGPFGVGWPMAQAVGRDVVIVAGGLGLAPLRPVIYRLLAERSRYGRIVLFYGARSPDAVVYRRELAAWRGLEVALTVDHATSDWPGHVGVVTTLIPRATFDPAAAIAFVCGPEIMMRFAIAALRDRGVGSHAIFLSLERNMKCAVGFCGHCQLGRELVCRDGPVFDHRCVADLLAHKEI